ncbi:MAG TPA: hypothetical protein VHE59_10520 [Mucilaginibacter sp.]|nr:hypothetical protein [Mucilaginibacter sp.]
MNPVLLYTDTQRINDEQATLANVITAYQAIYDAIKAVGVTPTIAEINSLVSSARRQAPTDFVTPYIANKLADAATSFSVNGVTFTRAAFMSMIAVPDISGIMTALQPVTGNNAQRIFIRDAKGPRIDLLSLANDVISAVAGANDTITALFTYYTASDASATMATQLQAICDAINTFDGTNNGFVLQKMPTARRNQNGYYESAFPGLAVLDGSFVVSLEFIRKYEQTGSLGFYSAAF